MSSLSTRAEIWELRKDIVRYVSSQVGWDEKAVLTLSVCRSSRDIPKDLDAGDGAAGNEGAAVLLCADVALPSIQEEDM